MTRSSDISSFTDFRGRLQDHLDRRMATCRPLFVTTNGITEAVVLPPAAFDALMDRAERHERLGRFERSEEDVKANRVLPAKSSRVR